MRVTIRDIAEETGLSVTTISLVLNKKGDKIPEKTKQLVMDTVKKMNYRPNQVAVGLLKKRTNTLGLVISDIRNIFFSTLAKGVEDECRKNNWNVILCNTNDKHEGDMEYIRMLSDKGVDGIVYGMAAETDDEMMKECQALLKETHLPVLMIDRFIKSKECHAIVVEHKKGGYIATKHLLDLGHTRIACVTGPSNLLDSCERLEGYRMALEEAGIEYDPDIIYEGNYNYDGGIEAVKHLKDKDVTAIFAFNDMTAFGVYRQLTAYGLNVPEDISLVGYDNVMLSEILAIPLTTIKQPIYEMGVKAAQMLIKNIESGESLPDMIKYEPELILRKSTQELKL